MPVYNNGTDQENLAAALRGWNSGSLQVGVSGEIVILSAADVACLSAGDGGNRGDSTPVAHEVAIADDAVITTLTRELWDNLSTMKNLLRQFEGRVNAMQSCLPKLEFQALEATCSSLLSSGTINKQALLILARQCIHYLTEMRVTITDLAAGDAEQDPGAATEGDSEVDVMSDPDFITHMARCFQENASQQARASSFSEEDVDSSSQEAHASPEKESLKVAICRWQSGLLEVTYRDDEPVTISPSDVAWPADTDESIHATPIVAEGRDSHPITIHNINALAEVATALWTNAGAMKDVLKLCKPNQDQKDKSLFLTRVYEALERDFLSQFTLISDGYTVKSGTLSTLIVFAKRCDDYLRLSRTAITAFMRDGGGQEDVANLDALTALSDGEFAHAACQRISPGLDEDDDLSVRASFQGGDPLRRSSLEAKPSSLGEDGDSSGTPGRRRAFSGDVLRRLEKKLSSQSSFDSDSGSHASSATGSHTTFKSGSARRRAKKAPITVSPTTTSGNLFRAINGLRSHFGFFKILDAVLSGLFNNQGSIPQLCQAACPDVRLEHTFGGVAFQGRDVDVTIRATVPLEMLELVHNLEQTVIDAAPKNEDGKTADFLQALTGLYKSISKEMQALKDKGNCLSNQLRECVSSSILVNAAAYGDACALFEYVKSAKPKRLSGEQSDATTLVDAIEKRLEYAAVLAHVVAVLDTYYQEASSVNQAGKHQSSGNVLLSPREQFIAEWMQAQQTLRTWEHNRRLLQLSPDGSRGAPPFVEGIWLDNIGKDQSQAHYEAQLAQWFADLKLQKLCQGDEAKEKMDWAWYDKLRQHVLDQRMHAPATEQIRSYFKGQTADGKNIYEDGIEVPFQTLQEAIQTLHGLLPERQSDAMPALPAFEDLIRVLAKIEAANNALERAMQQVDAARPPKPQSLAAKLWSLIHRLIIQSLLNLFTRQGGVRPPMSPASGKSSAQGGSTASVGPGYASPFNPESPLQRGGVQSPEASTLRVGQ